MFAACPSGSLAAGAEREVPTPVLLTSAGLRDVDQVALRVRQRPPERCERVIHHATTGGQHRIDAGLRHVVADVDVDVELRLTGVDLLQPEELDIGPATARIAEILVAAR